MYSNELQHQHNQITTDMLTQIINAKILTPKGWLTDGSVIIRDSKILAVTDCDLAVVGADVIDAKGMYVIPGGIVHIVFSVKGVPGTVQHLPL